MRVVENELIPVYEGDGGRLVNARELHEFLQSTWQFANWIQDRIERFGFTEGREFLRESVKTPTGGRPRIEYWLKVSMAKELCMVENNEQGKRARTYFLEMEERAKQMTPAPFRIPQTLPEALRLAADLAEKVEQQDATIQVLTPKAEFHDKVTEAVNCVEVGEFAKTLGTGPIRFFRWLKQQQILMSNNLPYQRYVDEGYLRVQERTRTDQNGQERTYFVTMVTGKGQVYLQKRFHGQREGSVVALVQMS
jgi:phage antirepressor YoqD-like protein